MKSRISLFNRGVSRSLLRRFWPLWTAYAVILLLHLPAGTPRALWSADVEVPASLVMTNYMLTNAVGTLAISGFAGLILAGAMFGYLYKNRMCQLMNSLPIRRETMFFTAWLTGLLPVLAADLLVALLAAVLSLPEGALSVPALLQWLAIVVMGNLCFYNFAVFCATLTGRKVFLALIYLFLNFAVAAVTGLVLLLAEGLVYGFAVAEVFPAWAKFLSPPVGLFIWIFETASKTIVEGTYYTQTFYTGINWGLLGAYCGLSVLFLLLGLWLYRRRQMETAGDPVAVPWAAPVLKILFTAVFTMSFALLLTALTSFSIFYGYAAEFGWTLLAYLLIGCFLGYFIAEMLQHRTVRVFRRAWPGFLIAAGLIVAVVLGCRFDVLGYQRYVPGQEAVACVRFEMGGETGRLAEPENIAAALDLHRDILALREKGGFSGDARTVTIRYELKNGRTVTREYTLPKGLQMRVDALCGATESQVFRFSAENGFDPDNILSVSVIHRLPGKDYSTESFDLTAEEAAELLENGLRRDAALGHFIPVDASVSGDLWIHFSLKEPDIWGNRYGTLYVPADAEHTRLWIQALMDRSLVGIQNI